MNDKIKDDIAYIRQWLFTFVLAVFGIASWIFTHPEINIQFIIAFIGFFSFLILVIVLHIKIQNIKKKWK